MGDRAPSLRSVLPETIEGNPPVVREDRTGIRAAYLRAPTQPVSAANPATTLSILTPASSARELGLAAGWLASPAGRGAPEVVDRTYRGRRAQLIRSRYACGDTRLGQPLDPTRCSTDIAVAIRLSNDRVLVIERWPAHDDQDVLSIADTLDLPAVDAAAQRTVRPRD